MMSEAKENPSAPIELSEEGKRRVAEVAKYLADPIVEGTRAVVVLEAEIKRLEAQVAAAQTSSTNNLIRARKAEDLYAACQGTLALYRETKNPSIAKD